MFRVEEVTVNITSQLKHVSELRKHFIYDSQISDGFGSYHLVSRNWVTYNKF